MDSVSMWLVCHFIFPPLSFTGVMCLVVGQSACAFVFFLTRVFDTLFANLRNKMHGVERLSVLYSENITELFLSTDRTFEGVEVVLPPQT